MPILEARFTLTRHYILNQDKRELLQTHGFHWSARKGCWWRLVGVDSTELVRELERQGIRVYQPQ